MEKEQLKARFFGMHIGCPFTHPDFEEPQELWGAAKWQLAKHHGFSASCFYKDGWVDIERCQLILKPLIEITDEDFTQIANVVMKGEIGMEELIDLVKGSGRTANPKYSITKKIYDSDENGDYRELSASLTEDTYVAIFPEDMTIAYRWQGEAMPVDSTTWVSDFLRSNGYSLPYLDLNPLKEGWAIIEENK